MIRSFLSSVAGNANPPQFNPLSLSWELLLDSRQIVPVTNGNPFSNWPDLSGNGRTANTFPTVGLKPIYRTGSSPTGLPLADFGPVGSGRQMFGTLPGTPINNANGFSFYAWYTQDSITEVPLFDEQILLACEVGGGFRMYAVRDVVFPITLDLAFSTTTRIEGGIPSLGTHVMSVICQPAAGVGSSKLYLDGVLLATGTWNTGPSTQYWLSGNAGGNLGMQGKIGFAGFGARADSDATRLRMEAYLRRTWG